MKKLLAILLFASSAFAQTISSIEPASGPTSGGTFVLMPILEPDVPGAFGSLWHTDASITNNSDTPLSISYGNCLGPGVPVCVTVTALPHQTASLLPLESGVFLPIPRDRINDIDI